MPLSHAQPDLDASVAIYLGGMPVKWGDWACLETSNVAFTLIGTGETKNRLEGIDVVYEETNVGFAGVPAGYTNRIYWDDELVIVDTDRPALGPNARRQVAHPWGFVSPEHTLTPLTELE